MTGIEGTADIVTVGAANSASAGPMNAPQGAELTHPNQSSCSTLRTIRTNADAQSLPAYLPPKPSTLWTNVVGNLPHAG
jgi:hypothetical protein